MKTKLMLLCIIAACGERTVADDRAMADGKPEPEMPPDVADEPSSDSSASCLAIMPARWQ
jgi:hypothetical protein